MLAAGLGWAAYAVARHRFDLGSIWALRPPQEPVVSPVDEAA